VVGCGDWLQPLVVNEIPRRGCWMMFLFWGPGWPAVGARSVVWGWERLIRTNAFISHPRACAWSTMIRREKKNPFVDLAGAAAVAPSRLPRAVEELEGTVRASHGEKEVDRHHQSRPSTADGRQRRRHRCR